LVSSFREFLKIQVPQLDAICIHYRLIHSDDILIYDILRFIAINAIDHKLNNYTKGILDYKK